MRIGLWVILAFGGLSVLLCGLLMCGLLMWTTWLFITGFADSRASDSPQSLQRTRSGLADPKGQFLAGYHGINLWEFWVSRPTGEGHVAEARATCDTASNMVVSQRATLTRIAAGGLLLGPLGAILSLGFQKKKMEGYRELYVLIESLSWAGLVECPPDEGAEACKFVKAVNLAASSSIASQALRVEQVALV